jgi:flavin reductase (DIM6/NTAB) family NADH-FMN oxidoreductase RutF
MGPASKKTNFPLGRVYQLLEPGPVVMVSTAHQGKSNIMTMSWHMMMEFEKPLIGCVISDQNFTFDIIKKTKECVINIPDVELA